MLYKHESIAPRPDALGYPDPRAVELGSSDRHVARANHSPLTSADQTESKTRVESICSDNEGGDRRKKSPHHSLHQRSATPTATAHEMQATYQNKE